MPAGSLPVFQLVPPSVVETANRLPTATQFEVVSHEMVLSPPPPLKTVGLVQEAPASAVVMASAPLIPLPPLPLVEPVATQSEDDPHETPPREVTPLGSVGVLQVLSLIHI